MVVNNSSQVHNHGPESGRGLDCPERVHPDGQLRGACFDDVAAAVSVVFAAELAKLEPELRAQVIAELRRRASFLH